MTVLRTLRIYGQLRNVEPECDISEYEILNEDDFELIDASDYDLFMEIFLILKNLF
jgi:hypothetical protein